MVHQIWLIETFLCHNTTLQTLQKIEWKIKIEVYEDLCLIKKCQQYQFVIVPINLPNFMIHFVLSKSISTYLYFFDHEISNRRLSISQVMSLRGWWWCPHNKAPWELILLTALYRGSTRIFSLSLNIDPSLSPGRPGRSVYRCFPHGVWVRTETGECGETGSRWDSHGYAGTTSRDSTTTSTSQCAGVRHRVSHSRAPE